MKHYPIERAFIISRMIDKYPMLADIIRKKMRKLLEKDGIISREKIKEEAKIKAMADQRREGLTDPINQESAEKWQQRVREHIKQLTDFYFALNFSIDNALDIIEEVKITNLQLQELLENEEFSFELFKEAEDYLKKGNLEHLDNDPKMEHIRVNIIRNFISDKLDFISIAKKYFTFQDLKEIKARIIGSGKIGGKAAGLLLAYSILKKEGEKNQSFPKVNIPACYFLCSEVFYRFFEHNNALDFQTIKYKSLEEVEREYPELKRRILSFSFPDDIVLKLRALLEKFKGRPMVVRSSSLLEDDTNSSFAGKYESIFVANNKTEEENLQSLLNAIKEVYSSVFSPDVIAYRREKNLIDYDEKMAVLIQNVVGERRGNYFFPFFSGVGFSFNMFRWSGRIKPEEGLLRIVLGLGTRAVGRVGNDYPRMVALSDPLLRPEKNVKDIKRYSQKYVDALNLETEQIEAINVKTALALCSPYEKALAFQFDAGGYFSESFFQSEQNLFPVITFKKLFQKTTFASDFKVLLNTLKKAYGIEVDTEFAVSVDSDNNLKFFLLQCRPLALPGINETVELPRVKKKENLLFDVKGLSPCGVAKHIEYIVYVVPNKYNSLSDDSKKLEIGRIIGLLNRKLPRKKFILIGPGRWGTTDLKLGVKVGYGDINNTSVLIELATQSEVFSSEVSYGTHFFQDLVEANIYPLSIYLDKEGNYFNKEFFEKSKNVLPDILEGYSDFADYVKVVDVKKEKKGKSLSIFMSLKKLRAIGVFKK
ncbi:phosphoenolpyruvate synthase [Thermotomaculum hydrothermale]|uniref:Phosphoenolpyruvate synthase n=1 Tax=Thermotomaculum hydrothermale TaxID=981385 RepID=A0A7R6SZ44_9BACT|nr:PEP/pyruvate-binding domain-containing protein [Thermotomaculum hydrothermale]BBB33256.1 phosphoenolpyruvate synthase [Thermotomaculum hydrothermale]